MQDAPIEIETGADPTAAVIVLHGLGADGSDFVPIVEQLALDGLEPVRFIFPHAPVMPVTANGGYRMRAWYDILAFDARAPQDEAGLRRSMAHVEALLQGETARGIASRRIVLAGFSQGCAMALMTGVRHGQPLAGIVGLSGYLPIAHTTAAERHPANQSTPIFLAHGTHDPVVQFARGEASRDQLKALGYPVEWHTYPMEHSVSGDEIADLDAFLSRVLKR